MQGSKEPNHKKKVDKVPSKKIKSELCTVMFLDIVGYTNKTAKLQREEFSILHDSFDEISKKLFNKYNGEIINKVGDAYLTKYSSATSALFCAIELQIEFQKYSLGKEPLKKIPVRAALHMGEVIKRGKNVFGDAVNTAARIESITKPGDIVLSEAVFQASNGNKIPFRFLGSKKMKGLKYPIKLFQVKKPYKQIIHSSGGNLRQLKNHAPAMFNIFIFCLLFGLTFAIIIMILGVI